MATWNMTTWRGNVAHENVERENVEHDNVTRQQSAGSVTVVEKGQSLPKKVTLKRKDSVANVEQQVTHEQIFVSIALRFRGSRAKGTVAVSTCVGCDVIDPDATNATSSCQTLQ